MQNETRRDEIGTETTRQTEWCECSCVGHWTKSDYRRLSTEGLNNSIYDFPS